MGILDELRNQAESIKHSSETERERQERLRHYYQESINPKLLEMYRFLQELSTHLNFVKLDVKAGYQFPVVGRYDDFKQLEYKLVADSDVEIKDIKFQFYCERDGEFSFKLSNSTEVARVEEFFSKNHVQFYCKKERDERYNVVSGDFRVKSVVPILFRIQADIENSSINMAITNFDGFGIRNITLKPEQITESFLDRFGSYIVRREADFMQIKLSDEDMQRIRERMLKEKQEQEEALKQAALAEELELLEKEKPKKNILAGLFSAKDKSFIKN